MEAFGEKRRLSTTLGKGWVSTEVTYIYIYIYVYIYIYIYIHGVSRGNGFPLRRDFPLEGIFLYKATGFPFIMDVGPHAVAPRGCRDLGVSGPHSLLDLAHMDGCTANLPTNIVGFHRV